MDAQATIPLLPHSHVWQFGVVVSRAVTAASWFWAQVSLVRRVLLQPGTYGVGIQLRTLKLDQERLS